MIWVIIPLIWGVKVEKGPLSLLCAVSPTGGWFGRGPAPAAFRDMPRPPAKAIWIWLSSRLAPLGLPGKEWYGNAESSPLSLGPRGPAPKGSPATKVVGLCGGGGLFLKGPPTQQHSR